MQAILQVHSTRMKSGLSRKAREGLAVVLIERPE